MAQAADPHELYQRSVQCVGAEIDFVDETYHVLRGKHAKLLREDFCGTANTSCEWVRRRKGNRAYGVDIDEGVLAWGREHNVADLGERATNVKLLREDVMTANVPRVDAVLAMNFSYWLFRERDTLRSYFETIRGGLANDGIFFLDAFGGYDCIRVTKDRHKHGDFTYIWDQAAFDPITHHMRCHIHFRFADGSKLDKAFSYEWRLWNLPEIKELLHEAGFPAVTVYWQGTDEESGEADGVFEPAEHGEADPAWIVYIVAHNAPS